MNAPATQPPVEPGQAPAAPGAGTPPPGGDEALAFFESQQRVQARVRQALDALGRTPGEANQVYAVLQATLLARIAHEMRITPEQAHARYGPRLMDDRPARGPTRPDGDAPPLEQALEQADLPGFLHETGHWLLDAYGRLAAMDDAPAAIRQDMHTLLRWLGVASLPQWQALTPAQRRPHLARLAGGLQAWLAEGRAPAPALAGPLARIRAWLGDLCPALAGAGLRLKPEVRAVFDRMLAAAPGHAPAPALQDGAGRQQAQQVYAALQAAVLARIARDERIPVGQALARYGHAVLGPPPSRPQDGPFGPMLEDLRGSGQAAVARLMALGTGEAVAALHHPDVGEVDLIWGRAGSADKDWQDGYGLAKIAAKHPEVMDDLQALLAGMQVVRRSGHRVILESAGHKAAICLNWLGEEKKWLLSAYAKEMGSTPAATIHTDGTRAGDSLLGASADSLDKDAERFYQGRRLVRGSYQPDGRVIRLLEHADLSTYLHETGHWLLDTYGRLAARKDAPPVIRRDMDAILRWLGVSSLDTWHAMSIDQQRPHHERFARGFEAYLAEGRAPAPELAGPFARIRVWMRDIYQSLTGLGVYLSPEVRAVFDRMLVGDAGPRRDGVHAPPHAPSTATARTPGQGQAAVRPVRREPAAGPVRGSAQRGPRLSP